MSTSAPSVKKLSVHELSEQQELALRALASELAKDIEEPEVILERHNLTREDYDILSQKRYFKNILAQAIKEWASASNTAERVKVKAAALIEEALPDMFKQLNNDDHTLTSRVDLFRTIARIGNLGNPTPAPQNNGEMFSIQINLGTDKPVIINQPLPPTVTNVPNNFEDA